MPLSGPGGKLSIIKHSQRGRLPDGVIPAVMNASNVMDMAFDPFNDSLLAVGKSWELKLQLFNLLT